MFKKIVAFFVIAFGVFLLFGAFSNGIADQNSEDTNESMEFQEDAPGFDGDIEASEDGIFFQGTWHDGPELKQFFDTLEETPEERYQREGNLVDNVYAPFFERLALPEEKQNELRNMLIEVRMSWNDLEEEVRNGGSSDEKIQKGFKKMGVAAWELDSQVEQLLGSSNYKKYNEYKSSLGIFMTDAVDEFEKSLGEDVQISKSQESRLVTAMAEEFESFIEFTAGKMEGPPSYRVEMRDKDVANKINANLDNLQNSYVERAKEILSEAQLEKYTEIIGSRLNTRKSWSENKVKEIEELSKTKKPILYRDFRDQ